MILVLPDPQSLLLCIRPLDVDWPRASGNSGVLQFHYGLLCISHRRELYEGSPCELLVLADDTHLADGAVTAEVVLDVLLVPGLGEVPCVECEWDGLAEVLLDGSPLPRAPVLEYLVPLLLGL